MVKAADQRKNSILTAPNILTFLRVLLVPLFLFMIFSQKAFQALAVFLVAGSTDLLDGLAARMWNQRTKIGTLLDPAADKLLVTAAFVVLSFPALSSPNVIPIWLTMVVIGRDVLISAGAFIIFLITGYKNFHPTLLGKICTFCQVAAVLFVLFFNTLQISPLFLNMLFHLTLLFTLLSGVHYMYLGGCYLFASK
ncbi:MAG: CDP-alcohol phosphatidyltransferase family protein [Candidatus Aminicenantes bacterium]